MLDWVFVCVSPFVDIIIIFYCQSCHIVCVCQELLSFKFENVTPGTYTVRVSKKCSINFYQGCSS